MLFPRELILSVFLSRVPGPRTTFLKLPAHLFPEGTSIKTRWKTNPIVFFYRLICLRKLCIGGSPASKLSQLTGCDEHNTKEIHHQPGQHFFLIFFTLASYLKRQEKCFISKHISWPYAKFQNCPL